MDANYTNTTNVQFVPLFGRVPPWSRQVLSVFIGVAFVLGVPGNCLVVFVKRKLKQRAVTDYMVLNLAICDLTSLLICAPTFITQFNDIYILPKELCKLHFVTLTTVLIASNMFIAITALERYVKITRSHSVMLTSTQAMHTWAPVFVFSSLVSSVLYFGTDSNEAGQCVYIPAGKSIYVVIVTSTAMVVTCISGCIMCFCYIYIAVYLFRRWQNGVNMGGNGIIAKRRANTLKTTKVLALVTFIFFFSSSLPCIASFSILKHVPTSETSLVILFFVFRCYFINNCVNPMFYMTLDSRFRQMAKEGLTQLFCKHRQKSKQTVVINTINLYSRRK